MIVYRLLPDGAFIAGDTESRLTCYAYPTSTHATAAKRNPDRVAAEMVTSEKYRGCAQGVDAAYDARNWARLPA